MKNQRHFAIIPTSSMADIAFLLLIFFLVTTTIANDIGLPLVLPPDRSDIPVAEINERNVLAILINSSDRILIEGMEVIEADQIDDIVREFVLNYGKEPHLSDSPEDAVVSIRTDRNTSHRRFIKVLDEVHQGYNKMYAERLGITEKEWRQILNTLNEIRSRKLFNEARNVQPDGQVMIPMQVSIAEPVNTIVE